MHLPVLGDLRPGHDRLSTARLRLLTPFLSLAVVATMAAATPVANTAPSDNPAPATVTADLRPVAVKRVLLGQRVGTVTGDGQTIYVANRTEFRPRRATVGLPPRLRARAWIVVDLDSRRVLGKYEARKRLPQASTLKLLTAVTATRTISPGAVHRVNRFEARQTCSCAGLRPGFGYRRDTLMAGMLLPSGNDAAEALAGSHPGGRLAFYRAMNRTATRLGATDTVAKNASGLTAAGSHSSARDLVIFLRAALRHRTISSILGSPSATIAAVGGRGAHTVWRSTDYVNRYSGSLGKSGWTTPAQNTLVVVTEVGGRRIAVATLGSPNGYSTKGARALTRWGAANADRLGAVGWLPRG